MSLVVVCVGVSGVGWGEGGRCGAVCAACACVVCVVRVGVWCVQVGQAKQCVCVCGGGVWWWSQPGQLPAMFVECPGCPLATPAQCQQWSPPCHLFNQNLHRWSTV